MPPQSASYPRVAKVREQACPCMAAWIAPRFHRKMIFRSKLYYNRSNMSVFFGLLDLIVSNHQAKAHDNSSTFTRSTNGNTSGLGTDLHQPCTHLTLPGRYCDRLCPDPAW